MPKKLIPFRMTPGDRAILEPGYADFSLWTQYYFDGWTPKWYQEKFYQAPQKNKLFVAGVRTGKSKGVAASFLHYAMYHANCRLANASISSDQAAIVYNDVIGFAQLPKFQHFVEEDARHPYPRIRLINGAEIWFRSVGFEAELWRGYEFDWINIDEAAYVQREAVITTLKGRLLGVGRAGIMTMTTSPKGKGWLFDLWRKGDPSSPGSDIKRYYSIRARTRDNDSLNPEDIADLEADYTERMIQQELEGQFLDSSTSVFPYEQILIACDTERVETAMLTSGMMRFQESHHLKNQSETTYYALEPEAAHLYLNTWDLGKKVTRAGRNAMVGGVIDITHKPWRLVAYRYAPGAQFGQAHAWITEWDSWYNTGSATCETVIDSTGKGDVLNEQLQMEDRIEVEGICYSGASKPQLVHALQLALEKGWLVFPFIRRIVDQLQGYELPDDKIPQDIVMMLAQGAYRARQRTGEAMKTHVMTRHLTDARKQAVDPSMDRWRSRREMSRVNRNRRTG